MNEARITPYWGRLGASAAIGTCTAAISVAPPAIAACAAAMVLLPVIALWTVAAPGRWVAAFIVCALLLPPLPVEMGNTGPHVALLFAGIGFYAGLLRAREWNIRPGGLEAVLAAYFFILLASLAPAAWYSGMPIALASLARVLLFGISVYVFFYCACGPWAVSEREAMRYGRLFFFAGAASALFACLDFYFQFPAPAGFGPQFVWLSAGVFRRAQGVFYEASTLGNLCAFFLVMAAVAFVRPKRETGLSRLVLLAAGAIFFAALIFSYSRGSVINLVAALAAFLYLRRSGVRHSRLAVIGLGSAVAAAAAVYFFFPSFLEAYIWRWRGSAEYLLQEPGRVLAGRLDNWRLLADFALQHPLAMLAGIGYKTLPYTGILGRPVVADNMYFNILLETGALGLGVLLLLNLLILRAAYRAATHPDRHTSFFGTWVFCFWVGQVFQMASGDLLTYWRTVPLYMWVLAVAVRGTAREG